MAGTRRRKVKGKSKGGSRSASVGGTSQTSFAGASMSQFEPASEEEMPGERPKADELAEQARQAADKAAEKKGAGEVDDSEST